MGAPMARQYGLVLWSAMALATAGLLLFSRGFLLKRTAVRLNSTCGDFAGLFGAEPSPRACWTPRHFARAVVLLVDGLRYDFVACNGTRFGQFGLPCRLLASRPERSRLYRFVADPPTTTLQRLQALTTGSLPTFVDAGANFAAGAVDEDNWLDQLVAAGRRVVFLGDDTWEAVFPGRFLRSHAFPSFDVRDLDTVDDGILQHLPTELGAKDWDVLIAHFLGVDHCGHRHGAAHAAMASKLAQMDVMLRSVVEAVDNDTVLLLMGDHGMTDHGDHGGDSDDELNSALFVYSVEGFSAPDKHVEAVQQIDLVPTLSLLLGVPIPACSLGTVVEELVSGPASATDPPASGLAASAAVALRLNVAQVHRYLDLYRRQSKEFPTEAWNELNVLHDAVERSWREIRPGAAAGKNATAGEHARFRELSVRHLTAAAAMCRRVWAKFDVPSMVLGIVHVVSAIAFAVHVKRERSLSFRYCCLLASWTTLSLSLVISAEYLQIKIPFSVALAWSVLLWLSLKPHKLISVFREQCATGCSVLRLIPVLIVIFHAGASLSNSFVVNEPLVLNFFLQTLAWFSALKCLGSETVPGSPTRGSFSGRTFFVASTCLLTLGVTTRMCLLFQKCREEQAGCEQSVFLQPLALVSGDDASGGNFRYLLSVLCVAAIPFTLIRWLKKMGNANGASLIVASAKYGLVTVAALICYYWTLQALPPALLKKLPAWQETWVPRAAFALAGSVVAAFAVSPLCVYVLPSTTPLGVMSGGNADAVVHSVYRHLKLNWKHHLSANSKPNVPVVYGLATVYSASMLILISFTLLCVGLLWGSNLAPAAILLIFAALATLTLQAVDNQINRGHHYVHLASSASWVLMASMFFYGTGHQPTLPAIQWHAAFVGSDKGAPSHWLSALKVLLNTAGAHVVFGLSFPLLLLWSRTLLAWNSLSKSKACEDDDVRGELLFFEAEDVFVGALYEGSFDFIILCGIKLLGAMVSACVHRRHLMVWKIFAPHFMYEAILFVFAEAALFLGWTAVLHINATLDRWLTHLDRRTNKSASANKK